MLPIILTVVVVAFVLVVLAVARRSARARALRAAETRRPVDQGKHVEL